MVQSSLPDITQPSTEMDQLPLDHFVKIGAFTRVNHREVYPAIDPSSPALSQSQAGKVVVITGASRGIGRRGFAASFAKTGARALVLIARSASSLAETVTDLKAINPTIETLILPTDISDERSIVAAFAKVKEAYGTVDVLISNAAISTPGQKLGDVDIESWWSCFEVNVRGSIIVTKAFLQLVGPAKPATIITVTSAAGHFVFPGISAYSLTKLVTTQLSAYLEVEYPNITAVSLHPGTVKTDMTIEAMASFSLDTPELVGGVGVWLSAGDKKFLNGRYVSVNWDVEELEARKEEIVEGGKLKIQLVGDFGEEQFL